MRYGLPSPFEEISHTADVGVRAKGKDLPETYARTALALAQLQAGGGAVEPEEERRLEAHGDDRVMLLVDFCRQALRVFWLDRRILSAVEIESLSDTALSARAWFGRFDPERHGEGMDIKAVTYARAAVEPAEGGFVGSVIVDI
ncbi:MAG TPA: archease [Myxococcales bacterium]|jgi:SHS2 domain-containing protein